MNFIYEVCQGIGNETVRLQTLDKLEQVEDSMTISPTYVRVLDTVKNMYVFVMKTPDDLLGWRTSGERACSWRPGDQPVVDKIAKAVDPIHYQGYIEEMQWIDAMSRIPSMRDPKCFKAALELQIRKYLDRNGQKDATLQEMMKALWYMKYLCAYIKNGDKPILVKDISNILK